MQGGQNRDRLRRCWATLSWRDPAPAIAWLRWGSTTDTRSSNFEGHEFRLAYAFGPSWNVMLRVYLVEGIELESATAFSREDGKRARLDFNIGF